MTLKAVVTMTPNHDYIQFRISHDGFMTWKRLPRRWPFRGGIYRSPIDFPQEDRGPVSIYEKTSFRNISWKLEATRLVLSIVVSLWNLTGTAAEVPVKFQSDRTILNTNLAASRLYEILRKDVFSDIETGPNIPELRYLFMVLA